MLIPKYWAQASREVSLPPRILSSNPKVTTIHCWRWSDLSLSDAEQSARRAVEERGAALESGKRGKIDYPLKPVREEILKEFHGKDGQLVGAVTRSALGFRVLNTAELAFVDVDFNRAKPFWLTSLFKKKQSPSDLRAAWEREAIARIEAAYDKASLSGRLYRTANGLRSLVTSQKLRARDAQCESLLDECQSDALYVKLCAVQESFRARLSPKPRRLKLSSPQIKFPVQTDEARRRVNEWLADYESRQSRFGTCEFIKRIGTNATVLSDFQDIIELHDSETCALERRELK